MGLGGPGYEICESFIFPNNWEIQIEYGMADFNFGDYDSREVFETIDESIIEKIDRIDSWGRRCGDYFRKINLSKDDNILVEYIEKNPDFLTRAERAQIKDEDKFLHDVFERTFDFPNGYSAKIEYWISPSERDQNFGMYTAKYRRMLLIDEKNKIIAQIFEDNPNYLDPKFMVSSEECDESMLL